MSILLAIVVEQPNIYLSERIFTLFQSTLKIWIIPLNNPLNVKISSRFLQSIEMYKVILQTVKIEVNWDSFSGNQYDLNLARSKLLFCYDRRTQFVVLLNKMVIGHAKKYLSKFFVALDIKIHSISTFHKLARMNYISCCATAVHIFIFFSLGIFKFSVFLLKKSQLK